MSALIWILLLVPLIGSGVVAWWRARALHLTAKHELHAGLDGAEFAQQLLDKAKLVGVRVDSRPGLRSGLSVRARRLSLRPEIAQARDLLSLGEVVHEVGHVLQAADGEKALLARLALRRWVQMAPLCLVILALVLGLRFGSFPLAAGLFAAGWSLAFLSNLMALPLELNAARLGRQLAVRAGLVHGRGELLKLGMAASAAALREFQGPVGALRTLLDSWSGNKS